MIQRAKPTFRGTPPFGWDAENGKLRRAKGMGYAKVADALNAEGHAPKRAAAWSAMSVRSVLLTAEQIGETK